MRWDLMQLILFLLMAYSQLEMVNFTYLKQKDNYASFFCFFNSYSITDYIDITREEKGRIGSWFWVFVISAIALVIAVVNGMISEPVVGDSFRMNQDDVWLIL